MFRKGVKKGEDCRKTGACGNCSSNRHFAHGPTCPEEGDAFMQEPERCHGESASKRTASAKLEKEKNGSA